MCWWRVFITVFFSVHYNHADAVGSASQGSGQLRLDRPPPSPPPHITAHFCSAVCLISEKVAWAFSLMASKSMF